MRARLALIRHWLHERQPDVVGMQELKLTDEQFPHRELAELGYEAVTHGQKGWNGVAILAKTPLHVTQRGLPGQEDFGARVISAQIGELSFTNVYVPNGKSVDHPEFPRKLAWLDALAEHLERRRGVGRSAILCGDLNVCPGPLDSWNEEHFAGRIFHSEAERLRFRRLLELGFLDVFRERFPETQAFSWWDYRGGAFHRKQGLRIDFVLAAPPVMARVKTVEIDREYRKKKDDLTPSDHAPVIVELA
jgi:exodeoxyribonuclease-3